MPLFVIRCIDNPDMLAVRLETRPVHLEYLNERGELRFAGALIDDAGTPIGSMIIVEAASLADAQAFAAGDPFAAAGLFATTEVIQWRLAIGHI